MKELTLFSNMMQANREGRYMEASQLALELIKWLDKNPLPDTLSWDMVKFECHRVNSEAFKFKLRQERDKYNGR